MSALIHGLIALSYLGLAGAVAFGAYRGGAVGEPATAAAIDRAGSDLFVGTIEEEDRLVAPLDDGIDFGQGQLFGTPRLGREG